MSSNSGESAAPIIIKKKHGHDEHESHGAWKIAYADFVTAMMAFFMILWMLSVTSEETRDGVAAYFNPISLSQSNSGGDGFFENSATPSLETADPGEVAADIVIPVEVAASTNAPRSLGIEGDALSSSLGGDALDMSDLEINEAVAAYRVKYQKFGDLSDEDIELAFAELSLEREIEAQEDLAFNRMQDQIDRAVEALVQLEGLAANVIVDIRPEGMRIQITDAPDYSMFEIGSARPREKTVRLIEAIAQVLARVKNQLSVSGHTDGRAYGEGATYTNWELSTDRAHAARRILMGAGVAKARIGRVEGLADTDHLVPSDILDPRNRRISITLLREGYLDKIRAMGVQQGPRQG